MKSHPLSSIEEMLLNHKQLFQSQLDCEHLGNLRMMGRKRGGVPAAPTILPKLKAPKTLPTRSL